ncbi:hypothetical protein GOV11_01570 [Candidatus Woesearchaeota archaeon]|nr:hypothetical protein [Candidatus Woesearchaeota archaeon]
MAHKKDSKELKDEHVNGYKLHPIDHASIDKIIKNVEHVHSTDYQTSIEKDYVDQLDNMRGLVRSHLKGHDSEDYENINFKDLRIKGVKASDAEKKKAASDLLYRIGTAMMARERGTSVKDLESHYSNKNQFHRELKEHIESKMASGRLKNFDSIVDYLTNVKNLPLAFDRDENLQKLFDSYITNTDEKRKSMEENIGEMIKRSQLGEKDNTRVQGYMNTKFAEAGHDLKVKNAPQHVGAAIQYSLPQLLNPEYNGELDKKAKHLKKIKKK